MSLIPKLQYKIMFLYILIDKEVEMPFKNQFKKSLENSISPMAIFNKRDENESGAAATNWSKLVKLI